MIKVYRVNINSKRAMKTLNNVVRYSEGFLKESKARESFVASKLAGASINGFYQYLDSLARTNPSMLHHVYEWGQVGDPGARLVELKKIISAGGKAAIDADLLTSSSVPEGGSEPFYEKAQIMEEGIPVVINEVNAQAMFFQVDGEEFFRVGPIVVENPGGEATRGSFIRAFEEFYNVYFDQMYLRAIRFYDHFSNANAYAKNFNSGVRSSNA